MPKHNNPSLSVADNKHFWLTDSYVKMTFYHPHIVLAKYYTNYYHSPDMGELAQVEKYHYPLRDESESL